MGALALFRSAEQLLAQEPWAREYAAEVLAGGFTSYLHD